MDSGTISESSKRRNESEVFVIKTEDREKGLGKLFNHCQLDGEVAIKANYNSADPYPASTHIGTLSHMIDFIKKSASGIVLAERSGMGDTAKVLEERGVMELASKKGFEVVVLDELDSEEWIKKDVKNSHWDDGFLFPKVFSEADSIVQTCCLKTHRFGGHFTMSLKNSVGMIAKYGKGHDYMKELHDSPDQREMIAEINTAYSPDFIIMDGIKGFSKGGPARGHLIEPGIILASQDRIALDAVGVATLRMHDTTTEVSRGKIFDQDQIARAKELNLGVESFEGIDLVPLDEETETICDRMSENNKEK